MASDREKEREAELESAMYTNCLLLGLDPAVFGAGAGNAPRTGNFRHSNPRMGEQLLYFLLSALRGPAQSAKDFDKVWPIFDSSQSREFRKIVQGIISELESQGALPRRNSRVSSLATCCGLRFVELLWQLSVHALREVHKRIFATDVASNPLPASLTDMSYLHAASLLPITKARIALERRKFLKNAAIAVQRQATWSNLAHEMTSEFRALCAEEAYLQQELEKLQYLRNKTHLESESWDESFGSLSQNSHLVQKATRLWDSILGRMDQHEVLASGPIEDLIAHREHRYRISGSSLLAAMDPGSEASVSDTVSVHSCDSSIDSQVSECSRKGETTVDIAEVLRCWTHALQRIHKQSLQLMKANDGSGPELLESSDDTSNPHTESLASTLSEHRQHLVSMQGLINQLKEAVPAMQQSIAELTEQVNYSGHIFPAAEHKVNSQAEQSGHALPQSEKDVTELASKLSGIQLEKSSTTALKLPQLFGSNPKSANSSKRHYEDKKAEPFSEDPTPDDEGDDDIHHIQNLKLAVREAALSNKHDKPHEKIHDDHHVNDDHDSRHFFLPMPRFEDSGRFLGEHPILLSPLKRSDAKRNAMNSISDDQGYVHRSPPSTNIAFYGIDGSFDQALSPPLLMDDSLFSDTYEDLLAPLSETDAALMER